MPAPTLRPGQSPKKRSAIWLIVGALGLFVFLTLLMAVAALMQSAPPLKVPGAQKVVLDDGTELYVQVTYGETHYWVGEIQTTSIAERLFRRTRTLVDTRSNGREAYMIWLTGLDPATGRPADLTWWKYSSVVDQYGDEVRDTDPHRRRWHVTGHGISGSESSTKRPVEPLTEPATVYLLSSRFPTFHTNKASYTLRLHDTEGKIVARVNLPVQHSMPKLTWTPDPLPVTKSKGDLGVTLTGVDYALREPRDDEGRTAIRVRPQFEATWNGKPFSWTYSCEVYDSMGNHDDMSNVHLSPHADAWKLQMRIRRMEIAEFAPEEQWQAPEIALPPSGKHQQVTAQGSVKGAGVTIRTIAGSGKVAYDLPGAGSSSGSSGSFGIDGGRIQYDVDINRRNTLTQIEVDAGAPHLAIDAKLQAGQRLIVRAVDDQGRQVQTRVRDYGGIYIVFLAAAADAKSVQPTFIVHREELVEFYVDPPEDLKPKGDE